MDSNRSAAGLRRSALAERARVQAEWAELKGTDVTCNALRGVVALVDVGPGSRALALRAALSALGASIVPTWTPLVTHVVWAEGGCRRTRARARALASQLVSPLWVEACAAAARRLPERAFPSATRPSDLPSPAALRRMLKLAEKENVPLQQTTSPNKPTTARGKQKLRISSDKSTDKSTDTSLNTSSETDIELRVNTAPRRALPKSINSPEPVKKSRRKLFTHKEDIGTDSDKEERKLSPVRPKKARAVKVTQRERRDLARAERMARRLANAATVATTATPATQHARDFRPRVVLTGMNSTRRKNIFEAIIKLGGRVQKEVNKKTTHVVLGSCCDTETTRTEGNVERNDFGVCENDITGIESLTLNSPSILRSQSKQDGGRQVPPKTTTAIENVPIKPRTLNALEGAARGCRILTPDWVEDSMKQGKWLYHIGYEVPHLKKISQKARIDRQIQRRNGKEYAYDIFCGLLVQISDDAEQKLAATTLLKLCGAKIVDSNTSLTADVKIGRENGQVSSKWVFDSVAAARIRTTKRYIVNRNDAQAQTESDLVMTLNSVM